MVASRRSVQVSSASDALSTVIVVAAAGDGC